MFNQQLIFVPCLILILITFSVLIVMFTRRVKNIKSGEVPPAYFKTYTTDHRESVKTIQAQRNFTNLHESPPIFYTLCIITYLTGNVTELMIGLSWAFLALRIAHTIIHITTNKLRPRMLSFAGSWLVIVIMSVVLLTKII